MTRRTGSSCRRDAGLAFLGLGTVQFGLDYGVSNAEGRTPPAEVARILTAAREQDIRVLDTAAQYGDSEAVLGQVLDGDPAFDIVTKTPPLVDDEDPAASMRSALEHSLDRLRTKRAYGLLLHRCEDLLNGDGSGLYDALRVARAEGLVSKIGVSVYSPEQVEAVMERYPVDLVQLPLSLFDQRMAIGGQLARLHEAGIEIHVRSVLLQGLLLMDPDSLPTYFEPVSARLRRLHRMLAEHELSPLKGAIAYARSMSEVDCVVVGVCSLTQLNEVIDAGSAHFPEEIDTGAFAVDDPALVDPRCWPSIQGERQ